jgi:hypothetical protein
MVTFYKKISEFMQRGGGLAQGGQYRKCFFMELGGKSLCAFKAEQRRIGRFGTRCIGTRLLSNFGGFSNDIEHIIVNLEGQP